MIIQAPKTAVVQALWQLSPHHLLVQKTDCSPICLRTLFRAPLSPLVCIQSTQVLWLQVWVCAIYACASICLAYLHSIFIGTPQHKEWAKWFLPQHLDCLCSFYMGGNSIDAVDSSTDGEIYLFLKNCTPPFYPGLEPPRQLTSLKYK